MPMISASGASDGEMKMLVCGRLDEANISRLKVPAQILDDCLTL